MFSVTVPKRPDQPAGLTLSSLSSPGSLSGAGASRRASKSHQRQHNERSHSIASKRDSIALVGSCSSSVIISSISPQSPFHTSDDNDISNNTNNNDESDDNNNNNNVNSNLQTKDEILLINNHRVKDPKRAAKMIKACTSGSLTIVASRGERMEGMHYYLARLEDHNKSNKGGEQSSKWQERKEKDAVSGQYQLQLGGGEKATKSIICGMGFITSNNDSLLRISSIQTNTSSPFARSGMKVGDVLLAVDGKSVKCVGDAVSLLSQEEDDNNASKERVVALLVYSFWDMRHKVLKEELQIEGGSGDNNGNGKQPWQATWSCMQADEENDNESYTKSKEAKGEYVILQIPNTTVTFQLDFDEDGTCSCSEPYKALESIPSKEGYEPNNSRRRQAFYDGNTHASRSVDDLSSYSESKSRHSRDDARAALELLYQKHVAPTIDALNYHTWRQVRLLANALDASVAAATSNDGKAPDEKKKMGSSRNFGASDMELATTAAMATIRQQRKTRMSHTSEKSTVGEEITKPRGFTPPPKHHDFNPAAAESKASKESTPMKQRPREPECAQDVHTSSPAEPAASQSRRPSRGEQRPSSSPQHRRQGSLDSFEDKLGKLQLKPSVSNVQSKPAQLDENENNGPPPAANAVAASTSDAAKPKPAQNRRRRPANGLRRRPSIVPVFKSSKRSSMRSSMRSQLSALSDSDEDSSASGTSTTSSSDDSDSSHDSDGSSDSGDESSGPRARHQARAQAQRGQVHQQPNDQRRRTSKQRAPAELSSSTQMVLYSPEENEDTRKKVPVNNAANGTRSNRNNQSAPPPTLSPHTIVPKLKRRLKMRNGDIRESYKVSPRIIGTGAFGTVRSCLNRQSREQFAVKSILKRGNIKNATLLKNEIALVQRVHHRNVVRVVDVIQDLEYIHIVMEECRGGDLFDKIVDGGVKLGEERVCEVVGSLVDAMAYLHDRDIVHRDLKAEHIMLTSDDINSPVKIIDFGLATIHSAADPPMTAFAGSAFTVAPEVVKRSYGKECDLWSVGVITYFLLTSRMPFNANSDKAIFEKILSGEYGYPAWTKSGVSEEAKDFIDRLLVVDPKRRLTAKQALSHLWIRKHNQNRLAASMNSHELALVPVVDKSIVLVSNDDNDDRGRRRSGRRRLSAREPSVRELPIESRQQQRRGPVMRPGRPVQHQQHRQRSSSDANRKNSRRSPRPSTRARNMESTGRVASSRGSRRNIDP